MEFEGAICRDRRWNEEKKAMILTGRLPQLKLSLLPALVQLGLGLFDGLFPHISL